ncbi:hypothetical protein [Paenibacillus sp. MBLB4367]|uniref:hypothetical protein n=1 Tax=Paenibacillus sp. MBLB4367 TaxID=3384767 RepID=UPI0039082553
MLTATQLIAYSEEDPPAPLRIVADGQANATVLVSVYADNQTWEAADTLVDYVHRSTGTVLPIVTDAAFAAGGNNDEGILIYVGLSAPDDDPGISQQLQGMDNDGFIIASQGNHMTIIGPSSWGTRLGVYEFLERYVGVMWLMPAEFAVSHPEFYPMRNGARYIPRCRLTRKL